MSAVGLSEDCANCQTPIRFVMIEDEHNGDMICGRCGFVLGRVVDDSPVKRVYEKDNAEERASKQQHTVFDPLLDDSIRSSHYRLDTEDEFLHEGFKIIDDAMSRLFPDIMHQSAKRLAQFYFKQAFKMQLDEKKGLSQMKRKPIGAAQADTSKRKKFSRRKAFIVSSILAALRRESIMKPDCSWYDVQDLNGLVEGKKVSQNSKNKCWRELDITFDEVASGKRPRIENFTADGTKLQRV